MRGVLELYKKEGETPLECIERFRGENPEYKNEKMTYAGRLDPMAEGVLLVLVGDECKKKQKYLGLDKEYEFEILWGFQTDTYDILGIPQISFLHSRECKNEKISKNLFSYSREYENELIGELKKIKGKSMQKYPPYSSMTVKGKQLHQWAREDRLDEIEIPEREVEIYNIEFLGNREINSKNLLENITERIEKISGDFRQDEIKKGWKDLLEKSQKNFLISKFKIKCSSGTYVREIASDLGGKLGVGAVAFSIKRTKIF